MIRKLSTPAFFVTAFAIAVLACTPTHAGDFGCGSYVWSSPYPADLTPLYSVGAIPTPPYFALHPPVYYDMPIPRTYGHGPWAYPPYVTTPEITKPVGEIIQNKYVPQPTKGGAPKAKTASAPLMIRNPYVVQVEETPDKALVSK